MWCRIHAPVRIGTGAGGATRRVVGTTAGSGILVGRFNPGDRDRSSLATSSVGRAAVDGSGCCSMTSIQLWRRRQTTRRRRGGWSKRTEESTRFGPQSEVRRRTGQRSHHGENAGRTLKTEVKKKTGRRLVSAQTAGAPCLAALAVQDPSRPPRRRERPPSRCAGRRSPPQRRDKRPDHNRRALQREGKE